MRQKIGIDSSFLANLGSYLAALEFSKLKKPGPYQRRVMLKILDHGFASAPIIRDDLRRNEEGWSTALVGRRLREISSKGLVKEKQVAEDDNPHNHKFFELTTAGLHSLLESSSINDLEQVLMHYPHNQIFSIFLYPYFSQDTFSRPTRKLKAVLKDEYFPSLCRAMESTVTLMQKQSIKGTEENLRLVAKNVIAEQVNIQLIYITFLTDLQTVRLLSEDDLFKRRVRLLKNIFDKRYKEIMELESGASAASA